VERVNVIIADPDYRGYLQKNNDAEQNRKFCSHHFEHLLSVARITWLLLLEEGTPYISREMAYAAGLLHDIGRWREIADGIDHAVYSAELARPLLKKAGFSEVESALIRKAIAQHRSQSEAVDHISPLSSALRKADKYERTCFFCDVRHQCNKVETQPHLSKLIY
jgi:uncharacterized protein